MALDRDCFYCLVFDTSCQKDLDVYDVSEYMSRSQTGNMLIMARLLNDNGYDHKKTAHQKAAVKPR